MIQAKPGEIGLLIGHLLIGHLLLAALPAVADTPQLLISLQAAKAPADPAAFKAQVTLTPANPAAGSATRSLTLAFGQPLSLDVSPGSAWDVTVEAAGYWSQPRSVVAGSNVVLELLEAGRIEGTVKAADGAEMPAALSLRFRPVPWAKSSLGEVTQACPIVENRFGCVLPAGELDLRMRARGFLAQYRWGAKVSAGGTYQAGSLTLHPGAAVVGWVLAPDATFRFSEVRVSLEPRGADVKFSSKDDERLAAMAPIETVNDRGFFAFAGVAPGHYMAVVRHPRFAASRIAPVEVYQGAETEIEMVRLLPKATLEVRLSPPLDPSGAPWDLELVKRSASPTYFATVTKGPASSDGVFRARDIEPGPHQLLINGSHGARWQSVDIEVTPEMSPLEVQLPVSQVEGVVQIGREPLEAGIWFGSRNGDRRVFAKSDDEGEFAVTLPKQESWLVEVVNLPLGVRTFLHEVEIPDKNPARIRLELPNTTLQGDVVDEAGQPIHNARVTAYNRSKYYSLDLSSDSEGAFQFRGLAPGAWDISAGHFDKSGNLESDHLWVQAEKDLPVQGVRLTLRRKLALAGLVVGADGQGVPGAKVESFLEQDHGPVTEAHPDAVTDVNGQFTLDVPAAARIAQLTVFAPGYAVTQLRLDVLQKEPLIIPLHRGGGTVTVTYEPSDDPEEPVFVRQLAINLFRDFKVGTPNTLLHWAQVHGMTPEPGRLTFPMLEPGTYTACLGVRDLIRVNGRPPAGNPACATGELAAGGELSLRVGD
jgi:hypothetical protein